MNRPLLHIVNAAILFTIYTGSAGQKTDLQKIYLIHGYTAPGFELVKEEFTANILNRGEQGAACAVYYKGEKVVDLWGGYRNKKKHELWQEHTVVRAWSTTKGLGAVCLARLHSQGLLDYDKPIAYYWPSFAQHGKDKITVRQLLSQQAGLCLLNREDANKYSIEDLKNPDTLSRLMENLVPIWEPGTKYGYHGASEGLLLSELLRRIDPKHRSPGRYFEEEIAQPLRLNYYIGLPLSVPDSLIAPTIMANPVVALTRMHYMPPGARKAVFNPKSIFMRSMTEIKGIELNNRNYLEFEDPSGNGVGEPRAIAAVYNEMIRGGTRIGITRATIDEIEKPVTYPLSGKIDVVMGIIMPTSLGFMKPDSGSGFFTKSKRAYGFFGANGSMGFADPEKELAFSYGGNYNAYHMSKDEDFVVKAVYKCIDAKNH